MKLKCAYIKMKLRVFVNTRVRPLLLYAYKTWKVDKRDKLWTFTSWIVSEECYKIRGQ